MGDIDPGLAATDLAVREAVLRTVTQTAARVAELRRAGWSYRSIAETLDTEGHRLRRAASWSAMSVRAVAQRGGLS